MRIVLDGEEFKIGVLLVVHVAIFFDVEVHPPVIARRKHDGLNVTSKRQHLIGRIVLLVTPQHSRVTMALSLRKHSDGFSHRWIVGHEYDLS